MDKSKVFQNKWLIAFIAVAVALVAAIVVIVVMGVSSTPDVPGDTTLGDGAETGVYYFDVEGGEVILSLNSGNKFTIAGTNYNKSGTYTVDGESLTLDFIRDEDGTATAAVNGNTVAVTFSDSTVWTFQKKVNYTVTFNTNGGSATDSVTVVNGRPAAKPADPTKDGSVFLGWYADEALTSTYNFGNPVTGDVTVYAYWAEKTVGQPEYNATFDLGYEGAEEITAVKTIGGKLYQLPTPEREGFTFMGWFVSDYEDGDKLTYQYADGIILDANTTLYAIWKNNADTKLTSPLVSVSGNTIKWNSVEGASTYSVKILDSEGNVLHSETLGSTQITYTFSDRAAGDYTVEVTAVAPNPTNNSAPAVRCYKNKALSRIPSAKVVNNVLVFTSVENAERYFITVDCGNPQHEHTNLNNNSSTVFDFSGCTMQPGGIKFTVTASAAGYANSLPVTFTYDRTLSAIGTIVYNNTNDSFVWDAVANATGYKVEVICGDKTTVYTVPTTSFSLANFSGDITVKVTPVSEGYNSPASVTGAFNKTAPAAVTNLKINGMVISWDDNGSTAYAVRIGTKQFETNTNSIDLSGKTLALNEGDECVIKVVAIKNGEYSAESSISAKYRDMSDAITYENNTVYWPAVIGSSKFEVRVNGGKAITVIGENSAKIVLDKAGTNLIEVRTADAPGATWYSIEVFAYTVTYNSRSFGGTVTEYVAKGDSLTMPQNFTNAGYTFSGWYTTPSAAQGNGKEFTSGVYTGIGDMVLYANWSPNQYNFNFNVSENVEIEATQWPVTYMKDFILPIPSSTGEQEGHYFLGWYTAPAGTGEKITDEFGNSVAPYKVIGDSTLYPYFAAALTFVREEDGTYGVRQGPALSGNKSVVNVTIPAEYNGEPVTRIRDNAFYYCENIETIKLPNTIEKIGVGAFEVCRSLKSVEVYVANDDPLYEAKYSSSDGALIYYDENSQKTYLEFFPRAKVGTYTIPEGVTNVRAYAFKYSTVEKVIIGKDVTTVADSSFYKCSKLVSIEFEGGRAENVTIGKLAFDGLTKLTTLVLPAKCNEIEEMKTLLDGLPSLTTINVEAGGEFYSSLNGMLCNGLGTELIYVPVSFKGDNGVFEAPLGIQSIGEGVFEGKTALTEVIIPEYLRNIGLNAFKDCTGIVKVTVNGPRSNALTIGDESFAGCTALMEVKFLGAAQSGSKGKITVGTGAFRECVNLDTLSIGENVNVFELGNEAFAGNVSLETISVADSAILSKIGNNTFEGCTRLKSFTIHASTVAIGNGAFAGCSFLNTVAFADGGGDINFGSYVFKDCERLTKIKLPATITSFDGSAFDGCERITEIEVDPANKALTVKDGVLYTKDMTELLYFPRNLTLDLNALPWDTLTKLGASAFKNNPQVTDVKIGAKIVELGDGAFEGCINLTSVEFLNTTDDMIIGDRVFKDCAKLTEVILPAKTTRIGNSAFYMTGLAEIDIPDAVTEIGSYAFSYTNITAIELPAALTKIGTGAFNMATKLTTVTFAEGANDLYIGDLEAYTAENPMEELPENRLPGDFYGYTYSIFYGTQVSEIVFPSNLKSIDDYAFYGVKSLTSVTIPENVRLTNLGKYAFAYTSFPSIELGDNLTVVNEFAFAFSKLQSAHIPATVTHIYKFAFATKTFTSITFDNGDADDTLELAHKSLTGANLTGTLVLPSHLAQIGEYNVTLVGDDVLGVFYDFRATSYSSSSVPKKPYIEQTDILPADKSALADNASLAKIEVAAGNTRYGSKDGVLYGLSSEDKTTLTTLLFSPRGNTGDENGVVTVPKTVVYVQHGAFNKMTGIKKIIFEEFDKEDPNYGQPLLTIGSYVGTAYESTTDPSKVIFSSGSNSPLEELSFPSHLSIMYSRSIVGVRNYTGTKQLKVTFNPDSLVEFEQAAMRGNSYITELNLPKLKRVALQAFYQSSGVTTIYIAPGSTATEFGNRAFESCSKLTTIEIPASVEILGEACFRSCSKLTSITYPVDENGVSSLTSIGTECFKQCAFTEFVIPEGVTSMGNNAFANCSKLTSITIPTTLENVVPSSSSLIEGCSTITAIHVAEGHPYLVSEDGVLYDKDKTTLYIYPAAKGAGYELPSTIKNIEGGALRNYKGTSLTLPDGLLHINNNAFAGAKLTSIVIPASVQTIKSSAFSGCSLKTIVFDDIQNSSLELIGAYAFSSTAITEIDIPDRVTLIGTYAFSGCSGLTEVVLPAALTELGNYTFNGCSKLASVTMQEGLAAIGNNCFSGCALTTVELPDSVATLGQLVFYNNKLLTSVTFTENSKLASIGMRLFDGCTALKEVTFGPLVEELPMASYVNYEMSIFYGCTALERVVLPANLKKIPGYLFIIKHDKPLAHNNFVETIVGNTSIKEVVMPTALEEIGPNAFHGCSNIESIDLPETLSIIGLNAFKGCTSLTAVNFEDGCAIKSISEGAFENTVNLTSIVIPESVTEFGARAFKNSALSTTPIGPNVTKIGDEAFYGCTNLTEVSIPGGVKNIGARAFYGCSSIESLGLASGLKNIGDFAFAYCTELTSVILPDTVTGITANPFMGCTSLESLEVLSPDFYYDTENGVLFDRDITMILFYAPFNTQEAYTIPDMVEVMGGAFANSQLKYLVLSETTKKIPADAFRDSVYLQSVVIPASVRSIADNAFNGCASLDNVVIPASVESIGNYAFAGCASMASFTLADRKTDIAVGSHLFEGCSSLPAIVNFPGMTTFTDYMYAGTGIVNLVIPENVANLAGEGVFMNCTKLETIDFGNVSGTIGARYFKGCTSLVAINTPENISAIGDWSIGEAFMGCTSLQSVNTHATSINQSAFENCTALTTVTFNTPDEWSMVAVESYGFKNCSSLANINLDPVYMYGQESFAGCVSLGGEIKMNNDANVYNNAFYGCTGISKITIGRPYLNEYAFASLTANTVIYIKNYKSYDEYVNDWNDAEWMNHTDATIEYYTPASGQTVTLTPDEIAQVEMFCQKFNIKDMDAVKAKMLDFKTGYTTLFPADTLTKEEQSGIYTFCEEFGIKNAESIMNQFLSYRANLSATMLESAFEPKEMEGYETYLLKEILPAESANAFLQAWYDYKISYSERNPADELTKEEQEQLRNFMKEMGMNTERFDQVASDFIAYRKYLASKMPIEITHIVTPAEQAAIDTLYKEGKIGKEHIEIFQNAIIDYKTNFATYGFAAGEPSKEETAMIYQFLEDNGLKSSLADEWFKNGSYVAFKDKVIARTTLSDAEIKALDSWQKQGFIDDDQRAKIEENILAYKASFNRTDSSTAREDLPLVQSFCDELGLPKEVKTECVKGYIAYVESLISTIM